MLKSDHALVKRLLRELDETTERAVEHRQSLVARIERELKMHAQLEEEVIGDMMKARKDALEEMWDNPLLRPVKKLQGMVRKVLPVKVKTTRATVIGKLMRDEAR